MEGELSASDIFKPHTHASYRSYDQTNHSMMMNEYLPSAGGSNDRKWTRAGKPKVKTGCVTCKIRRVKCGEEKPECQRCIKFGIRHFDVNR
jgi:hypothetical protein